MQDQSRRGSRSGQPTTTGARSGRTRWVWIVLVGVAALVLIFWLTSAPDVNDPVDGTLPAANSVSPATDAEVQPVTPTGNDVEEVTEETPLPEEDADPNAVVPQDAVIPPAPIREDSPQ